MLNFSYLVTSSLSFSACNPLISSHILPLAFVALLGYRLISRYPISQLQCVALLFSPFHDVPLTVFRHIPDTHSICRCTPCRCRCVAVVCLLKTSHTTTSYSTDMKSYTFDFWISVWPDFLSINDLEYLVIPLTLL